MKLQVMSDLHLEFGGMRIENAGADVLVLAGDIFVADYFNRGETSPYYSKAEYALKFFRQCCDKFDYVVYIMGNHEHYMGEFNTTIETLRNNLLFSNLIISDNDVFTLKDKKFLAGTMWTNFDYNPVIANRVSGYLNDYRVIKNKESKTWRFTPEDALKEHNKLIYKFDQGPFDVIITHHAPSFKSRHIKWKAGDEGANYGYYSHLDDIVMESKASIWIHGHTHDSHDYCIGDTRIVCNPRGYVSSIGTPENREFNPNLVVEI